MLLDADPGVTGREGAMKRFAAVLAFGLGLFVAAHAEAGKLPQGITMVQRMGNFRPSHRPTLKAGSMSHRTVDRIGRFHSAHPQSLAAR
jgi:hypothetical protein